MWVKVIFFGGIFSSVLFDAVRRFVALSGQVGVKGSDPSVKELMAFLRRGGFSSSQISELSGGKWSGTLIRQYTVDWGGVDDSLDVQKQSIMVVLRELVSSGMGVEDVEFANSLDRSARAKGSSLGEVAELNLNLGMLDLQRGEIGRLVMLSRELVEQGLTPGMVRAWMTMDQELVEDGFNKTARRLMYEACEKYGGVTKALEIFNGFIDLYQILHARMVIDEEVKQLEEKKEKLSTDIEELQRILDQNNDMINAIRSAALAGFNVPILAMISVLAKDLGGPYKVVDAIQNYRSFAREMDEELERKKAELEKLNNEISEKGMFLNALQYTLAETNREYDSNYDVRSVVELLENPRGICMKSSEVLWLLTRVIESGILRIEENPRIPFLPNPALDTALEDLKALAKKLQSIIDAETGGL